MRERLDSATKAEKKLWGRLMRAWDDGHAASRFEIAAQYTSKYPDIVWGWIALADILVSMAHYEAAHQALSRAEKMAPPSIRQHICAQWGHLYNKSCDLKRAERWYRRAVECKATTPVLIFLGAVLAQQGRFSEAKRCHRRAARLATDPPDEAYYNLGLILRAERRYSKALECFERAIKIDPKDNDAREARKDVLRALKMKKND